MYSPSEKNQHPPAMYRHLRRNSCRFEIGGLRLPSDCLLPSPDWPHCTPPEPAPVGFPGTNRFALIQAAVVDPPLFEGLLLR